MNSIDFRKELMKVMPGYNWTVHKPSKYNPDLLEATGIQSSGFNRLSTLSVARSEENGIVTYEVKSSGFGAKARWMHTATDGTLARALRELQSYYQTQANDFRVLADRLQTGRKAPADRLAMLTEGEGEGT